MRFTILFAMILPILALSPSATAAGGYLGVAAGTMIPTLDGFDSLVSLGPTGGLRLNEYLALEAVVTLSVSQGSAPRGD